MKSCPHCETVFPDSQTNCPTHGALLNQIRELEPGMLICNRYRIVRWLGGGGISSYYQAQNILMDQPRVLCFLSSEIGGDQALALRLRNAVKKLRAIRSKYVQDYGDLEQAEDGSLFYATEYLRQQNLNEFLCAVTQPFYIEGALLIAHCIAEGLMAAHAEGLAHGEITPANVVVERDGIGDLDACRIVGFDRAAMRELGARDAEDRPAPINMEYAAPEQWNGAPSADLGKRSDLYGLGEVLYETLTMQTVFQARNIEGWMMQHLTVAPRPPSELRSEVAQWRGLDELVLRLLAKDPCDRPRDAEETLKLIGAIRAARPRTTGFL
jgi:eukaryotic-like serine/threonine-protein kinase